jgi:hypothetical protein
MRKCQTIFTNLFLHKGNKMKRLIMAVFFAASLMTFTTTAHSENFNYIVGASVDGGQAKWAQQLTKQWNKFLKNYGHTVSLRYIKQQQGKKALTEFATTYKNDHTVILQPKGITAWVTTSGGWKGYDPKNNVPIAGQLNGTFVFAKTKLPDIPATHVGGGAETILDVMAMVVMICGPMELSETLQCQKEKLRLVYGWKGSGQRRKAYLSNDIQITRDGFAHMRKTYKDELKSGKTKVWFSHGIVDGKLGMIADPNSPHTFFDKVYYKKWNKLPSGDYFNVYRQTAMFRSAFGKHIIVHANNPHYLDLVNSFKEMLGDKGARKVLDKKLGVYPWTIGKSTEEVHDRVWKSLDKKSLKNMEIIRRTFKENTNINPKLN